MIFNTPRYFQDTATPTNSKLAGSAALTHALKLRVPIRHPVFVSQGSISNGRQETPEYTVFDNRYAPDDTIEGHLTFVMRNETLDLLFLKRLFEATGPDIISGMVKAEPTGRVSRRLWFFYEWLLGHLIDLPDTTTRLYVDAIEPADYVTGPAVVSSRHRIRNNMLGSPIFCPIIRRTASLQQMLEVKWNERGREAVGKIHPQIIARAASFLLLSDSKASYEIEGERPPRNRLERWMKAVAMAGRRELSIEELERLQAIVIEGEHMVHRGLRNEGGFIGDRDMDGNPLPEFVSARHEDLEELITGLLECYERMGSGDVDAVIQAACVAFAFVFIHPFEDGNGRVHRYLMHHVLVENNYTPKGVIFPISSVLLDEQETYGRQLRKYSGPLLDCIDWVPTPKRNVRVTNDTRDLYRYGDYTELSEFLYTCVIRTITEDLPREIEYLKAYDAARENVNAVIEIPDNTVTLLINMIRQNSGKLSKGKRKQLFSELTDEQVEAVELAIADAFETFDARLSRNKEPEAPRPI